MLLWTWGCTYLFELVFQFCLVKCTEVGLLGCIVVLFLVFLRNLHTVFHSGCTTLRSHQQCTRVSFRPQPHLHMLFVDFLIVAIVTVVMCYLSVVLIYIPLMISDVGHLFMCLLAIVCFLWRNVSSCPLCNFWSNSLFFASEFYL